MNSLVSRRTASLLLAGGLCALMGTSLSACASAKTTNVGSGGSAGVTVSASPSPSAAGSATRSVGVGVPVPTGGTSTKSVPPGPTSSPKAQLSAVPAGAKLTPIESASLSPDGKTLYLGLESMGGACGQYDVVVQESGSTVEVGLVHLPAKRGEMCPMYEGFLKVPAQLAAPLNGRTVIDLATGQRLNGA